MKSSVEFLKNIGTFHIAFVMNCNLRCSYCITDHGTYGMKPEVLPSELQKKFMDDFLELCDHPVKVEFGTGETMLAFDQFIGFVDAIRARRKKLDIWDHISVTTNGTLLDHKKIDELLKRGVIVIFSIDGSEEVHKKQRTNGYGETFHARILDNYNYYVTQMAIKNVQQNNTVMGVVTLENRLAMIDEFWQNNGNPKYSVSLALPRNYEDSKQVAEYREIQQQYLHDLEKIAFEKANSLTNPSFLNDYSGPLEIYEGWCNLLLDRQSDPCGIFKGLLAINGHGQLFPCELFINSAEMGMGSLVEGLDVNRLGKLQKIEDIFEKKCECRKDLSGCPPVCFAERYGFSPDGDDFTTCEFALKIDDIIKKSYEALSDSTI